MALFKFVISDKERSVQVEKDQVECPVVGKKIGEKINGDFLGLDGYELSITGGHDKNGFPMRKDIEGGVRRKVLSVRGIGFSGRLRRKKKLKRPIGGLRKRKTVVGNSISLETVQINCKILKQGTKSFSEVFPPKSEPKEEKTE